jgi:hypothetical protein
MNPFDEPQHPLVLHNVLDRGVPNMERVALRATQDIDVRYHGIVVGVKLASGTAIPLNDNFFWLGVLNLRPDDWIFVYTRGGHPKEAPITERPTSKLYSLFWARPTVLFQSPDVVPILIRMDPVQVGNIPNQQKQLNR